MNRRGGGRAGPAATLADLAEERPLTVFVAGLKIRCTDCKRSAYQPMSELIARHGANAVAYRVAERLVCSTCGRRPLWWWIDARTATSAPEVAQPLFRPDPTTRRFDG